MKLKRILVLALFSGLFSPIFSQQVKNVIFLIGDGMGINHVYTSMVSQGIGNSNFERCPYSGFSITYSADDFITDSGAGGTALACGIKTNNGMIGMDSDSVSVSSVLQVAKNHGLSTGIVAACAVTHATPASYVAHQKNRDMQEEIAADFLNADLDVFIGGGKKFFYKRKDKKDLLKELEQQSYQVVSDLNEMKEIKSGKLAGFVAEEHPEPAEKRDAMLAEATTVALDILSNNEKGFFLMVEGSQIDWASHANKTDYLISEIKDFDKTIGVALDFAEKNENTLVVIVADHETGGLLIENGNINNENIKLKFTRFNHSGGLVPVFSYGAGAEKFSGIQQNTSFKNKIISLYGFE